MTNATRFRNPARRIDSKDISAFRQLVGSTEIALLGDGFGNIKVPSTSVNNQYFIRFTASVDADGFVETTQAQRAYAASGQFYDAQDIPVRVRQDPVTGAYIIEGQDPQVSELMKISTAGLNKGIRGADDILLKNIRNFRTVESIADTTVVNNEPGIIFRNGVFSDVKRLTSDNDDLASFIPTAGNERLVIKYWQPSTLSMQFIAGATRTISGTPYTLDDVTAVVTLNNPDLTDFVPIAAYRLADAQTNVTRKDRVFDLRQFINTSDKNTGSRAQRVIESTYTIPSDHNAYFIAPVLIEGELTIEGTMTVL